MDVVSAQKFVPWAPLIKWILPAQASASNAAASRVSKEIALVGQVGKQFPKPSQ